MSNKRHVYFRNPQEGITTYSQSKRYPGGQTEQDEEVVEKNYTLKREDYKRSIQQFYKGKAERQAKRNKDLQIPAQIDLIKITFHDIFDSSVFENKYRDNFGLTALRFTEFNTVGLFGIIDNNKFDYFIKQLQIFIDSKPNFHSDIIFIKEFTFYSSDQIIQYRGYKPYIILDLVENVELFQGYLLPLEKRLLEYFQERNIKFYFDEPFNKIELLNATEEIVKEIVDNFDIIQAVNSYISGVVKPNIFNLPEKSYGFEISNSDEYSPLIGIIDTGISDDTPLKPLMIIDNDFNLTSSPVNIDEANHGSAVATLAALGKKLYPNHNGRFKADAKLISIKVINQSSGHIVESELIQLIRQAHKKYGVQIFTLTIGYLEPKANNSEISEYAYALDRLSYELNILIFIAIGNVQPIDLAPFDSMDSKTVDYPAHFGEEFTNLFSPAESMNNLTIGAAASNLENNDLDRISPSGTVPAIYSRTFHYNWQHRALKTIKGDKVNWKKANTKLFKPDICNHGGDLGNNKYLDSSKTGIKILSTKTGEFFIRDTGTSFATPLAANLAARIIKSYPELEGNMQTVKALIINSAEADEIGNAFVKLKNLSHKSVLGHGIPNDEKCLYSSENRVTMILEDIIKPEQIKSYSINIPHYVLELEKENAVLKISATLCFKFMPLKHHHIAYCPFHLAFGIFKNRPLETGINNNKTEDIKLVTSATWSQDYYNKRKILSNTQKISFNIPKKVIKEENCTFKIAVNTKLHKLLNELDKSNLKDTDIAFSLVFTIEENPIKNQNSGRLYDELSACNSLEALLIGEANLEADVSIE
jgi:Subtilase family